MLLSVMAQAEAPASLPLSVISCQKQTGVCVAGSLRPSLCSIRVHMQGSEVGWPPLTPSLFSATGCLRQPLCPCLRTLVFGLEVDVCLGGVGGISVSDVDYSSQTLFLLV